MSYYHLEIRDSQFRKDLFLQRLPAELFAWYEAEMYYREGSFYCFKFRIAPDRRNREALIRSLHQYLDTIPSEDKNLSTYSQRLNR